jgi:tetratricopeptide (TPR) repeat protein
LAEQRHRDPVVSLRGAGEILAAAPDRQVAARAWQVVGLAQHELGRFTEAVASFRQAISLAVALGHEHADEEATARANLAPSLVALGDTAGAEEQIALAWARSSVASRGVVGLRQGIVFHRTGRNNEALAAYQRALHWFEETDDQSYIALARLNLGIINTYRGNHAAAVEDLAIVVEISRRRDLPVLEAMATHNMGYALGRLGKLPDAMATFARAKEAYAALGHKERLLAVLESEHGEILMLAGLVAEARAAAQSALETLLEVGDLAELMECRLLLARTHLAAGDYPAAAAEAARAVKGFRAASRLPFAAMARYVGVQAEMLELQDRTTTPPGLLRRCRAIAAELESEGWPVEAVHVHTFAGRVALALGHPVVARTELAQAAAARTRGTADLRAQAWHANALLHLAEGNRAGAKRALSRGMAVVDEYRASLGATELRVYAASHGAELARLGTRLAIEDRRAVDVLRWAERWRAGALRRPPVRPPDDEALARDLTALRQAQAELREARLSPASASRSDQARIPAPVGPLVARVTELERSVRNRTLLAKDDALATGRVDVGALRQAVGHRWLIEFVAVWGELHAVTVTADRVRLHDLGPTEQFADERAYLLFAAKRALTSPDRKSVVAALAASAARLDNMLLAPLGIPADMATIVVPTGILHGLPWATLPGLAGRETIIAPSAVAWLEGVCRRPAIGRQGPGSVVLIAGPGLPGALEEVRRLRALYSRRPTGSTQLITGADATADVVLAAFAGADVVHLAAHGSFRADSPLFSSVLLADGPLTVYELERVDRAPRSVVLASCDAAVSAVHLGDELLGTASALIGLGVGSVVAPVMPVPDGATTEFMVALHRHLLAGDSAAAALAHAGQGHDHVVAATFVCIGCDEGASAGASG